MRVPSLSLMALAVTLYLAPLPTWAQGAETPGANAQSTGGIGIAAIVDDQVISSVDVNERISLVMGTTNIPDTPENREHLAPQILHQLVDEKLQMEEAKRDGITVSDAKLKEGIAEIEKQNGKEPGSLEQFIGSKGLSKLSLYAQVRAQMAWTEVVRKKIRPKVHISDQEVARYTRHAAPSVTKATATSPSVKVDKILISAIHIPVDTPSREGAVAKLAQKLVSEIRAGASFEAVASQFSSSVSGPKAMAPFWVETSQIDPAIGHALLKVNKGGITDPVRTATGYQIIKLMDIHAIPAAAASTTPASSVSAETPPAPPANDERAELAFKQILMTLKPDAKPKEAELLLQLAKEVQKSPGRCEEKSMAGAGDLAEMDFRVTLTRALSSELPEKLRDFLMKQKVGTASDPVITPQGVRLFMLCERIDLPPSKTGISESEDTVRQAIYMEKLELEAQKYMRDLRRETFIELRAQHS